MIRIAGVLGAVMAIAIAGSALAHHSINGPCETLVVESQHDTTIVLTGTHELTLNTGPVGDWPTTYSFPVPAGTYHLRFFHGEVLDVEDDRTIEACPPTPRPTPLAAGHTPRPAVTPPPTDTAAAYQVEPDWLVAYIVCFLWILPSAALASLIVWAIGPRRLARWLRIDWPEGDQ